MRNLFSFALVGLICIGCASNRPRVADNLNGLGPVHHPVSTRNPEAQRAFDEGLARVYGFNHDAAIKAFKRAADLDPDLAMAYWGQALALGPNYNAPEIDAAALQSAYNAVHEAIRHSSGATQSERDFILALQKRYTNDPKADLMKLQVEYADAMGALAKKYPDDLDAATLWAESMMNLHPWQLWHADGTAENGTETIIATLERVLARNPNHVGANHYYIHAVEASPSPQRALDSAARLATLAPNQGHLVHMPAHIYIRVGDYPAAIRANQNAIKVDDTFIACCHPAMGVYPVMYYNHNIHFLMAAACMANQSKLAIDSADRIAANVKPIAASTQMVEPMCAMPWIMRVRFAKWDDILAMSAPDASMPATTAAHHFARAMAFAAKSDLGSARAEQAAFEAAREKIAGGDFGNNTVPVVLEIGTHLLTGRIRMAAGDSKAAIEEFQQAVILQDKLTYDEPPPWPWSMRETLGGALLATKDALRAEQVFRDDLARHANNPRSLFGLAEALRAQGKSHDAESAAYQASARDADISLKPGDL